MTPGDSITATFNGTTSGQIAVGTHIAQQQVTTAEPIGAAELHELRAAFADLRAQVAAQAPADRQSAAAERIDELEQALLDAEPDTTTIAYVRRWFATKLPQLAGAVAGVLVHPAVGRIVGAAGDAIAAELGDRGSG